MALIRNLAQVRQAHDEHTERAEPLEDLLAEVARGAHPAYELVYDRVAGPVYGILRRVLRDATQSQEVAQEVLLQVWTQAARFDRRRGSAMAWVMTLAHRRAVDRVRSEVAATRGRDRYDAGDQQPGFDCVAEEVALGLERSAVRSCLGALTALQREAITLAYYDGLTYTQTAQRLGAPLGTVKTRIRDGLVRMRDCLGVTA